MTDKQIIIDGIDVTTCGHFARFEGKTQNACYIREKIFIGKEEIGKEYCSCETFSNCYYKQLKQKEQLLKKIEEFRHNYCMNCEDLLKPNHSCKGCNMVTLKNLIEGKDNE